jgi:hypothetical protein
MENMDDLDNSKEEVTNPIDFEFKEEIFVSEIQVNNNEEIISSYPSLPNLINDYVGIVRNDEPVGESFHSRPRSLSIELNGKERLKEKGDIDIREKGEVKD